MTLERTPARTLFTTTEAHLAAEVSRLREELAIALIERRVADETTLTWMNRYADAASQVKDIQGTITESALRDGTPVVDVLRRVRAIASQTGPATHFADLRNAILDRLVSRWPRGGSGASSETVREWLRDQKVSAV